MLEAQDYFLRSIKADENRGHYTDLALLYIHMGKHKEAKEAIKDALNNDSSDAYAYIRMGQLYFREDKLRDAIQTFRHAVCLARLNPEPIKEWAAALIQNKQFIEAEIVLQDAIKRFDKFRRWELHLMLCRLQICLGDDNKDDQFYDEALKEAKIAANLKPQSTEPYFYKGIVHFKLGELGHSRRWFQHCVDRDENHIQAKTYLGRVQSVIAKKKAQNLRDLAPRYINTFIFLVDLSLIWLFYYWQLISEAFLQRMVFIHIVIIAVTFLLPWGLVQKVKLTSFEAEFCPPIAKEWPTINPKIDIGITADMSIKTVMQFYERDWGGAS